MIIFATQLELEKEGGSDSLFPGPEKLNAGDASPSRPTMTC